MTAMLRESGADTKGWERVRDTFAGERELSQIMVGPRAPTPLVSDLCQA